MSKGLTSRHIQFIAIGGAIGSGLFLGSGQGIVGGGPSLLVAYAAAGLMMYFLARALGELTMNDLREGSFTRYAEEYVGPLAGFVTGWGYWMSWVMACTVDLTAIATFLQFWWPALPLWESMLAALAFIYGINCLAVRVFGEMEFSLALIKVVTILAMIATGLAMLAFGLNFGGDTPHLATLWEHGGIFPKGLTGFLSILPIAFFSFGGTELVGITAREAEDPAHAIPKAINGVIARVVIFYLGALSVIMILIPWDQIGAQQSPFVLVFDKIGLPAAAGVINFVVLTAVLSSSNSGLFAAGRTLAALALKGHAPAWLHKRNERDLPVRAISVSAALMLVGVVVNYLNPSHAFGLLATASVILLMWSWASIAISHWCFRRNFPELAKADFRMPLYPYSNMAILAALLAVVGVMAFALDMATPVLVGLGWLGGLVVAYFLFRKKAAVTPG
jgi:L-asparagine transporter-like permease